MIAQEKLNKRKHSTKKSVWQTILEKTSFVEKNWLPLTLVIYLIRVVPLLQHPTLWAEDATVFYGPMIKTEIGFFQLAFTPYNGQFWLFDFLVAKLVILLTFENLSLLPLLSTIVSLLFTLIFSSFWLRADNILKHLWQRRIVFLFLLLAPSSYEPLGNVTNLHSYLLLGVVALAGWQIGPMKIKGVLFFSTIAVSIFTSINGIFALFVFLAYLILNNKHSKIRIVIISIAIGFQINFWKSRTTSSIPESLIDQVSIFGSSVLKRIGAEAVVGQTGGSYLQTRIENDFWIIVGMPFLLLGTYLISTNWEGIKKSIPVQFIMLTLTLYFGMVLISAKALNLSALTDFTFFGRYLMVVHCLIFVLFVQLASMARSNRFSSAAILMISIIMAMGVIADFRVANKSTIETRVSWKNFASCMHEKRAVCDVVIPPGQNWGNWGIEFKSVDQ
ncbi:hypothetical protein MCEMKE27_01309 [Candidatus Nanopelagicaceae bacterium]